MFLTSALCVAEFSSVRTDTSAPRLLRDAGSAVPSVVLDTSSWIAVPEPAAADTTLSDLVGAQATAIWPLLLFVLLVIAAFAAGVRIWGGSALSSQFPKWKGW